MSLIQWVAKLLHLNKGFLMIYFINTFVLILISYLLHGVQELWYPLTVSLFILLVYLTFAGVRLYIFTTKLEESITSPQIDVNVLDHNDLLIFGTINEIHDQYNHKIYQMNNSFKERNSLFSQWIHNMKVSISIIGLAADKGSSDAIEDIKAENQKLRQNLEECLNVLRLDDFSRDYLPEKTNLHQLVTQVINDKKRDFIYQEIYPKVSIDEQLEVYTDSKWCSYMLEQILSNAIKYSAKKQHITIKSVMDLGAISLVIQDNGVGIDPEDLPRIFDPFFTGKNGRNDSSATGIGLYMVKYISNKLGHDISVSSQKEIGTEVTLAFLTKV
ncbi:HAMP domain-containing histidine kinase [Paenibacillus anaericanus]|uniref:histidine kinase n=1 Tax=Paenibacillus anaericanus TaxID=170367 RepID=A0A3S1BJA2_9BACL|nr:sensor histidine kinase [Paenibacillus anaericanus]RUT42844.1 HAMP domain-containing histidine kinase [Paenibacillus anaericanus]